MDNELDFSEAKVLMVDDTPANIDVLRKVLAPEGYKLSFANSGEKALKICARAAPDLILLDVMMPGMDGFETCGKLKEDPQTRDIPIIFITAKTDTDDLVAGFQQGAVDYITKPFKQEEVIVRVRTHVAGRLLAKNRQSLIQDLQATEQRFRLLATWSPIGIFQADAYGQVVFSNQKFQDFFHFREKEENAGERWLQAIHVEDKEKVLEEWAAATAEGHNFLSRFRLASGQWDEQWIEVEAVALCDGTRQCTGGFVGTAQDITQEKVYENKIRKAKEDAELAMKAKSEFLANMTHELRTPLNAIIGYSEMLGDVIDTEQDGEDLDKITSAGKYLLSLINNILDLSKVEANKMQLSVESVDIPKVVHEVSSTIKPLVSKNQNELKLELPETFPEFHSDATKLRQVLYNLLSNACKFTQEGTITLRVTVEENEGTWFSFAIEDSGIGMTEEQLAKLFQKYSQATKDTSAKFGGTGLGLVLTRQFARLLGGDIVVTSEYGKGSCFTARLPQIPPQPDD